MCFQKVPGKDCGHTIAIFALSTCGWCRKTKQYIEEHEISYEFVDVDRLRGEKLEKARSDVKKYNPRGSFPTIVIDQGKVVIIGYRPEEIKEALGI